MGIDELIDALGGTGKVSAACGVSPPVVSMWKARGSIPVIYWVDLVAAARKLRLSGITYESLTHLHSDARTERVS
jgi:hypothetical protein